MVFRPLSDQDISALTAMAQGCTIPSRICDITPVCLLLWRKYYKTEICYTDNAIYTRLYDATGVPHYNYPLSPDPAEAILALVKSELKTSPIYFCTVPASELDLFHSQFPNCEITPQRQFYDYLYLHADLAELKGRKFSGQRNQINRFYKENPVWSFEPLSSRNAPLAAKLIRNHFLSDRTLSEAADADNRSVLEILENPEKYPMIQGAVLLSNGCAIGLALGEQIGDTLYVHTEKADRNITGAYQMMVNQFAKYFSSKGVKYINREDDNGDEGLRKAKLAYHPYEFIEKYLIKVHV